MYISEWLVLGPVCNASDQAAEHHSADGHPVAAAIIADIDKSSLKPAELTAPEAAGPVAGDTFVYTSPLFPAAGTHWQAASFGVEGEEETALDDNIHRQLASAGFAYRHHALAFFLVYVTATEETKRKLLVRSDDSLRVWLNGEEITTLAYAGERDVTEQETEAEVVLQKGENALLCAVADTHYEWSFSARFADDSALSFATARGGLPATPPAGKVDIQLKEISDSCTVFEPDQVLTDTQLNSVTNWFEDQQRLGRLLLDGAGVVAGLRISLAKGIATVTKGVGLTTDGDLLQIATDTFFDRFRPYDRSRPEYAPFTKLRNANGSYRIYELIPSGRKVETQTLELATFAAATKIPLEEMTAVFYMEHYVTDPDFCSVVSCNNLGRIRRSVPTVLLVPRKDAETLLTVSPPYRNLPSLPEIAIPRVSLTKPLDDARHVIDCVRDAAENLYEKVLRALPSIYSCCREIFEETLPSDPSGAWTQRLADHRKQLGNGDCRIAYFLGLVREVAETFNLLRELVRSDETWLSPPTHLFPKHLLLGNLDGSDGNRTPFYPSPLVSRTADNVRHARFLVKRIETLIENFQLPKSATVRITPNRGQGPEERSIPFFFNARGVFQRWSYRLHCSGRDRENFAYDAASYDGVARPCESLRGYAASFRIEGHLGQKIETALPDIRKEITDNNLPLAVRPILAGDDLHKVLRPQRVTDLHRFHRVLRADLATQMEDIMVFTAELAGDMSKGIEKKIIRDEDGTDRLSVDETAGKTAKNIIDKAKTMKEKADRSYKAFDEDPTWVKTLQETVNETGNFRYNFGHVLKTEFNTPYDSLIGSTHLQWLDWIGKFIGECEKQRDHRLRLSRFLERHPGLEHTGNVPAGGTFVLVHDHDGIVIADFSLPYHVPLHDDDMDDVKLDRPIVRPGKGIRVTPSIETVVERIPKIDVDEILKNRFDKFEKERLTEIIQDKLDRYKWSEIDNVRDEVEKGIRTGIEDLLRGGINDIRTKELPALEKTIELGMKEMVKDIFDQKFAEFRKNDVAPMAEKVTGIEREYFTQMRSALETMSSVISGKARDTVPTAVANGASEALKARGVWEYAAQKAKNDPENVAIYTRQRDEAQQHEADAVINALEAFAAGKIEVTGNPEATRLMGEFSESMSRLKGTAAGNRIMGTLKTVSEKGTNSFNSSVATMIKAYD